MSSNSKAPMAAEAAPLEQNIKNLECDGTPYRVVKEEPKIIRYVSFDFCDLILV